MTTILITGASQGIGFGLARQYLAHSDWQILTTCLDPGAAPDLISLSDEAEGRVEVFQLDVDDHAAIDSLSDKLRDRHIDVLWNNAGIKGPDAQDFGGIDYDHWARVLRTNLMGPMKMAEAFVEQVAASEKKLIVATASGTGSLTFNDADSRGPGPGELIYYRTSKAGVNMITRNLAFELKDRGITVLALAPGHVRTEMGGSDAPLSIEESVNGMRRVIDSITFKDSGTFRLFDGSIYPW